MLNAVVTEKDKTVILEFPMDYFQLFKELGNAGIKMPPGRIHLSDKKDDSIRVKLYSDNDFGNHLITVFKERDTLEDVQTAVTAIEIAPDAVSQCSVNRSSRTKHKRIGGKLCCRKQCFIRSV